MEVVLDDGTTQYSQSDIQICWDGNESAIYYYSYDKDGNVKKGGLYTSGFSYGSNVSDLIEQISDANLDPYYCETVSLVNNSSYGLRIKVLYNDSKVVVFPTDGTLPIQGYKLTSTGEITTGEGSEEKATVIVHKSFPFASDIFDYGIYTPKTLN